MDRTRHGIHTHVAHQRQARRAFPLVVLSSSLLLVVSACTGDSPQLTVALPQPAAIRAAVTGAAAAALGPDGKIQLPTPNSGDQRELTAVEATAFANAWAKQFAPSIQSWLEEGHGSPIAMKSLASCGRPLYARSAFVPAPQNIPAPFRRFKGPWWLVTLCESSGSPSVSVAVSAWATDMTLEDGHIKLPLVAGSEFVAIGIPAGHVGEFPSAPEVAIDQVSRLLGRRVTQVPELITPMQSQGPPQLARWHIMLEGTVTVGTRNGSRTIRDVFVGPTQVGKPGLVTSVAAVTQPPSDVLKWASPLPFSQAHRASPWSEPGVTSQARRPDTPVLIDSITSVED